MKCQECGMLVMDMQEHQRHCKPLKQKNLLFMIKREGEQNESI